MTFSSIFDLSTWFGVAVLILHTHNAIAGPGRNQNHSYFPPHSPNARNISNMVLLYADSRSLGHQDSEFHLNAAKVQALLLCSAAENSSSSRSFFDTVLVTGYAWDDMEKCFWPGQCPLPMNSTDWLRILDIWAEQSIASVNNASSAAAVVTKVVVALMYPDTRQNAFGIIDGRLLNFSMTDDRVTAVKWWMSLLRTVVQSVPFRSIELVGWYWYLEDIPDYDRDVIKSVADLAHDEGELLTWIPSYDGSAGDGIWKDASGICRNQTRLRLKIA